eukprot:5928397-Alexandrium_andersonii.AAC.1
MAKTGAAGLESSDSSLDAVDLSVWPNDAMPLARCARASVCMQHLISGRLVHTFEGCLGSQQELHTHTCLLYTSDAADDM